MDVRHAVGGEHVLLVEDIVDTGHQIIGQHHLRAPSVARRSEPAATAPRITYLGEAFRDTAAHWDVSLSGQSARIHGDRFNPPDKLPVLYLCTVTGGDH